MRGRGNTGDGGRQTAGSENKDRLFHGSHRPGSLTVVGLGPGDPALFAPMAQTALQEADMVVGYTAYIELVPPPLLVGKTVAATGMTHEVARCRTALEAAAQGRRVVLVSSGDAGVYGMAGLALEMLTTLGLDGHVTFTVVPGIPAVCAAAALLGAPLTHDFAVISLSDLLTPRPVIEQRLEAAFAADFVVAIYNPRSRKRSGHLTAALACAARHRSPETPVGMVKSAFRPAQAIRVTSLAAADPAWADMLTIVIVGNSASRMAAGRILTPRGYAAKYDLGQ